MSSKFENALWTYVLSVSELCQVIGLELCQVFANLGSYGAPASHVCYACVTCMYVTYVTLVLRCRRAKALDSTFGCVREGIEVLSLYCIVSSCVTTHWLLIRVCGLFIHLSYLAFLCAGSYGHYTRSQVRSMQIGNSPANCAFYAK